MTGFFPVDRGLFTSSTWLTGTPEEKVLWVWLLGNKDDDGVVRHRELAISFGCGLSRQAVDGGLHRFAEPDPDSRTKDNEGRRIDRTAEGFVRILNHAAYYSKDYSTPRWRKWKDRKQSTKLPLQRCAGVGERLQPLANGAPTKDKDKDKDKDTITEQQPSDAEASGARAPRRPRQMKLTAEGRSVFVDEAGVLVKAWIYLTGQGAESPPTPGLVDALVRLNEASYTKTQRCLVVVAATTENYFREMAGLKGLQAAVSLGGRPRVKDGVVISHAKNQAQDLLSAPRRYSEQGRKVLSKLGALEEATARGWRPA